MQTGIDVANGDVGAADRAAQFVLQINTQRLFVDRLPLGVREQRDRGECEAEQQFCE